VTTRGEKLPSTTPRAGSRPSAATLERQLGADLSALIVALGVPVVEVVRVTTIRAPGSFRASFALTLADGQVLKGRRLNAPADVARVTRLSALLDPRYFPPILAHRGHALLTRWVPGRSVPPEAWAPADLRASGQLQARLHRLHVSAELTVTQARTLDWTVRLDSWLGDLAAGGALDAHEARAITRLVVASAPATTRTGVCHTDFCADNIILSDAGDICVIDNEGLSLDSPEFDLARTWYRWPMTNTQQRAYADGYSARDHAECFADHFLHWALLAVLDSAAYRVRVGAPGARVPLERLAELQRTLARDESFPRLLRRGGR
jgi:aminoglycoside phosphotransferase